MMSAIKDNLLLSDLELTGQKDYWLNKLSGDMVATHFLMDKKENDREPAMEKERISITDETGKKVMELGKHSDLSVYVILLCTLKSLIYRYMNIDDIIVISPIYKLNISSKTLNDLLLIRSKVNDLTTFKGLLLDIRTSVLEAYENQDYPCDKIIHHLPEKTRQEENQHFSNVICRLENIHENAEEERIKDKLIFS
jgi:hypothetical protein